MSKLSVVLTAGRGRLHAFQCACIPTCVRSRMHAFAEAPEECMHVKMCIGICIVMIALY